ncbi:MAG: hypothetical protein HRT47_11525 [Candidatus Caenarcaniphilales bacterium]|nr:hypothetical protein [Candidatus Caenarcaniphilales bacterium]
MQNPLGLKLTPDQVAKALVQEDKNSSLKPIKISLNPGDSRKITTVPRGQDSLWGPTILNDETRIDKNHPDQEQMTLKTLDMKYGKTYSNVSRSFNGANQNLTNKQILDQVRELVDYTAYAIPALANKTSESSEEINSITFDLSSAEHLVNLDSISVKSNTTNQDQNPNLTITFKSRNPEVRDLEVTIPKDTGIFEQIEDIMTRVEIPIKIQQPLQIPINLKQVETEELQIKPREVPGFIDFSN